VGRLSKGGRQGGAETPALWKRLLDVPMRRAKERWTEENLDAAFHSASADSADTAAKLTLDVLAWADDLFLFAHDLGALRRKFVILTEEMHKFSLTWKPESIEVVRSWDYAETSLQWKAAGCTWTIPLRSHMVALVVWVEHDGGDLQACQYRIRQGWFHWHERKAVLCDKRIPLRMRWERLRGVLGAPGCRTQRSAGHGNQDACPHA